ncbi:mandelate racemase/muconate lactonizing enzyme family protein [Aeromonas veronii]
MNNDLNISGFKFTEVIVPANHGTINSPKLNKPLHKLPLGGHSGWSIQFDEVPKIIVEMTLDNGVVGLGEFYRAADITLLNDIARILIGKNLNDLALQDLPIAWCREYDGFECAIWDAYAKSKCMSVVSLLGGQVQDRVKVGAWTGHRLKEEIGELASKFSSLGYDSFKFKCDLEDDVASWCQEVKNYAPKMSIVLDPNERWENMAKTKRLLPALEEVGNISCLEDPLPRWQLLEYQKLRNITTIPIFMHVSLPYVYHGQRPYDAINAIAHNAVDGFNFNCGLANFQRLDSIARTANIDCWHGSELDLGILEAMYVHSVSAAKSCTLASDIFGRSIREHDLLEKPLSINNGYVSLPPGDGLGVSLDYDAVEKYKTKTWKAGKVKNV